MAERETSRLIAWSQELRRVHSRLRAALETTRAALNDDDAAMESATRDLLLYCHGFCVALDAHHRGEDHTLFPAIEAAHPELAPVLRSLERDHSMIGHLVGALAEAVSRSAPTAELEGHLQGIAAIMENHFRFEERRLLVVLETLSLDAPRDALGPL